MSRQRYINILSSSLELIKQQSKVDWIKYGDAGTRFFHAKAKQRKLQLYVYSLLDDCNVQQTGFEAVSDVLQAYYSEFFGSTAAGQPLNQAILNMGPRLTLEQ